MNAGGGAGSGVEGRGGEEAQKDAIERLKYRSRCPRQAGAAGVSYFQSGFYREIFTRPVLNYVGTRNIYGDNVYTQFHTKFIGETRSSRNKSET